VRDMCDAIGHPVVRLKRVRFGPIADPALKPGEHRDLTAREVALLRQAAAGGESQPRSDTRAGPHRSRGPSKPRSRRA